MTGDFMVFNCNFHLTASVWCICGLIGCFQFLVLLVIIITSLFIMLVVILKYFFSNFHPLTAFLFLWNYSTILGTKWSAFDSSISEKEAGELPIIISISEMC